MITEIEKLLWEYNAGTTCHKHMSLFWTSDDDDYVILKHTGHSEYIGRHAPAPVYCPTTYDLVPVRSSEHHLYGRSLIKQFVGRWKDEYLKEVSDCIIKHKESQLE